MKFKHLKFKYRRLWRLVFYSLAVFAAIFILAALAKMAFSPFSSFLKPSSQPGRSAISGEPVAADIFFSNEPEADGALVTGTQLLQLITKEIDQAQKTIEIAMYSLKSPIIKEAIYRANQRGVKVTLILDSRKAAVHDQFFGNLPSGIKRLDIGSAGQPVALMHHKFALIDRGADNERLIFGSFNWTELQAVYDRSFIFMTGNHELVSSFGREFDRLAKGEGGRKKLNDNNYHPWDLNLEANSYHYEVWFGPGWDDYSFNRRIFSLLAAAKSDIKIMIWSFTDTSLAEEILRRARTGIKITILADNLNFSGSSSVFQILNEAKSKENLANLEILNDAPLAPPTRLISTSTEEEGKEELDPFLHHHLLIVDSKEVLFGTNNWSKGGSYSNDESVMVSDDPEILRKFLDSFSYNYQLLRPGLN